MRSLVPVLIFVFVLLLAFALAVDSQGSLYVGDINGKRAQKFVKKK